MPRARLAECVRLAKQDITIRTALLEARYLWGDQQALRRAAQEVLERGRRPASGQDFVEAKLAERDERHARQGESRYLVEPNIKEGKGGLRDLQTLYWIGKYLYHVEDAADLVAAQRLHPATNTRPSRRRKPFCGTCACICIISSGRAEERLSFDVQPELARALGFTDDNPRRAVEAFMQAYFLVAKDVGDLTRIFCAALEEQNRKQPALARRHAARLSQAAHQRRRFLCRERPAERRPSDASAAIRSIMIRIFHIADAKNVDMHPDALRTITRSLDLITDDVRDDPEANRLFLEILSSRRDPERALRLHERSRRASAASCRNSAVSWR